MRYLTYTLLAWFLFIGFFLVSIPFAAAADGIFISEIMYDLEGSDSGREWIEVYNGSDTAITITDWSFRENGTDHWIEHETATTVSAGEAVIIADDPQAFRSDWPDQSVTVFDSSFSLNNTGESLALIDDTETEVFSISYTAVSGADGTGDSLHITEEGGQQSGTPTPGSVTAGDTDTDDDTDTTQESTDDTEDDDDSSGGGSGDTEETCDMDVRDVAADIPSIAYVHVPISVSATITACDRKLIRGHHVWNMGDGYTHQVHDEVNDYTHTYQAPGEYVIVFQYFTNTFASEPYKEIQQHISVSEPPVSLAEPVVSSDEVLLKLTNTSDRMVDISGWRVQSRLPTFRIPAGTHIAPGTTTTFPSSVTQFTAETLYPISLHTNTGERVDVLKLTAPESLTQYKKEQHTVSYTPTSRAQKTSPATTPLAVSGVSEEARQPTAATQRKDTSSHMGWYLLLGGIIVFAVVGNWWLGRIQTTTSAGDDVVYDYEVATEE